MSSTSDKIRCVKCGRIIRARTFMGAWPDRPGEGVHLGGCPPVSMSGFAALSRAREERREYDAILDNVVKEVLK